VLNGPVVNRKFAYLDALETVLVDRCRTLRADQAKIKYPTLFH
jgi:hypothetical protein